MQHQSYTITPLFRRLSVDKIFPRAAIQEKKATLEGTFERQSKIYGNDMPLDEDKEW